jgi:hypothetical protein
VEYHLSGGIQLRLLMGQTIPIPVPEKISKAITFVEIKNTDSGRDGFQIALTLGREGSAKSGAITGGSKYFLDYNLLSEQLLKPFNRVIIIVILNTLSRILFDGLITNTQVVASDGSGIGSKLVITGEDISVVMNRKEEPEIFENQADIQIVTKIITSYAKYGIMPVVIPPVTNYNTTLTEKLRCKAGTDLEYLRRLASKNDYIFFVEPTDIPGANIAYWGPKELTYRPKNPLNVNMGPDTNVTSMSFQYDALKPISISGTIKIPFINTEVPIKVGSSSRTLLASKSPNEINGDNTREIKFRLDGSNFSESYIEAQSLVNCSMDLVSSSGELDTVKYGDILRARGTCFVRGAGLTNDGIYYVKSVTHKMIPGHSYSQSFELTREGLGSTLQRLT